MYTVGRKKKLTNTSNGSSFFLLYACTVQQKIRRTSKIIQIKEHKSFGRRCIFFKHIYITCRMGRDHATIIRR
jgi:hypothetical protein